MKKTYLVTSAPRRKSLRRIFSNGLGEIILGAFILLSIVSAALYANARWPHDEDMKIGLPNLPPTIGYIAPQKKVDSTATAPKTVVTDPFEEGGSVGSTESAPAASEPDRIPNPEFPLGTDSQGRDLVVLIMKAPIVYFIPGMLAVILAILFGVSLGIVASYWENSVIGMAADFTGSLFSVIPQLILALSLCLILNISIYRLALLFAVTASPKIASAIRNKVLVLKKQDFIVAARELGVSDFTIIMKHILLYNCWEVLVIQATFLFGEFLLLDASLGYFGKGMKGGWGKLLDNAAETFGTMPYQLIVPATIISVAIMAWYLLGDGLIRRFNAERSLYA